MLCVSHVKTPHGRKRLEGVVKANHYLSRFYAFESKAPYRVVGLSGFFCLPAQPVGAANDETIQRQHPLAAIPIHNPLNLIGDDDDTGDSSSCAAIHFVTGMTEKADDPSRLIIAYGVSYCTSWFIEVDKEDVINMLFPAW